MNYQTFKPHADLESLVKCYWTLEVPAYPDPPKQRIIPDGCIEIAFILADDIKRYTSESDFVIQPRAMVLGQITKPFYIQPAGRVTSFAIRFYPYGFANFITTPLKDLSNKETPLAHFVGAEMADTWQREIMQANDTQARIAVSERYLLPLLNRKTTVDALVRSTINALIHANGKKSIKNILNTELSRRRQTERKFSKQVGISPKQLGRIIRLQAALKILLSEEAEKFSHIAYEAEYYDQAHFIRDFKEFTGIAPTEFLEDKAMILSSLIYKNE